MGRPEERPQQRNLGQETIDDELPPPGIGGSEPFRAPGQVKQRSILPDSNNQQPHEEDLYYPHGYDQGKPASFPPKDEDDSNYHEHVHAFPPTSHGNVGMQFAQHSPAPPQFGGVPMGAVPMGQVPMGQVPMGQVPMGRPMNPPVSPFNVNPSIQGNSVSWDSNLFDCMNDPENALITAFVPCVTFGQIAEILDNGNTTCATSGALYAVIALCIAAPCIMSCTYRTKLRARYGLIESPAQDWVVHCFCEWCALCQEYRELKRMGIDPTIGWQGNEAKKAHNQFPMAAPAGQRMTM